mmetsp:Transcript_4309/g.7226  ORF Transcript_4309/g.7226 Transcript_4309/m.7226 type:complete len:230 (+) Transcript_4309:169-858(+)
MFHDVRLDAERQARRPSLRSWLRCLLFPSALALQLTALGFYLRLSNTEDALVPPATPRRTGSLHRRALRKPKKKRVIAIEHAALLNADTSSTFTSSKPVAQQLQARVRGNMTETTSSTLEIMPPPPSPPSPSSVCAQKQRNYWTFEVCLGGFVRQLHAKQASMSLGKHVAELDAPGEQQFRNGDICAPTRQRRQTTVRLHCTPRPLRITSIQEPSPCTYEIDMEGEVAC